MVEAAVTLDENLHLRPDRLAHSPDNGDGILDLSEVFGFRFQVVEYLGEDLYLLSIIA